MGPRCKKRVHILKVTHFGMLFELSYLPQIQEFLSMIPEPFLYLHVS